MQEICPQCNKEMTGLALRIVQDSCGHKKCRMCLLQEENGCITCKTIEQSKVTEKNGGVITTNYFSKINNVQVDLAENYVKDEASKEISNKELTFKCNLCQKENPVNTSFKKHVCAKNKCFECEECNKRFCKPSQLEAHRRGHSGERPHKCDTCGRTYTHRGKLNRHMKTHTDNRQFKCEECGKGFYFKEALRSHARCHSGVRPYACEHCQQRFAELSNLQKHLTIHTKVRPFMCAQCGKTFGLKSRLTVHSRIHKAERQFECAHCHRKFINNKDLQRHQVIHSGIKPFACTICKTTFRRKDNLERHMKNTHPGHSRTNNNTHPSVPVELKPIQNNNSVVIKPQTTVITSNSNYRPHKEQNNTTKEQPPTPAVIANNVPKTNAVPVINGPVKLAFKTSTFKNNYNIRNKEFNIDDSVNIYQRILSPMSSSGVKDTTKKTEVNYETCFEQNTHAVIKNIKFKLPPEYTYKCAKLKMENSSGGNNNNNSGRVDGDNCVRTITKVDSSSGGSGVLHWRKRTSSGVLNPDGGN